MPSLQIIILICTSVYDKKFQNKSCKSVQFQLQYIQTQPTITTYAQNPYVSNLSISLGAEHNIAGADRSHLSEPYGPALRPLPPHCTVQLSGRHVRGMAANHCSWFLQIAAPPPPRPSPLWPGLIRAPNVKSTGRLPGWKGCAHSLCARLGQGVVARPWPRDEVT